VSSTPPHLSPKTRPKGNLYIPTEGILKTAKGELVSKSILGFGIGIALGIVFAPAKGEETRARLREKAKEVADLSRKKAAEMADASKEKAAEFGEKSDDRRRRQRSKR
jgi:hypothetical protein